MQVVSDLIAAVRLRDFEDAQASPLRRSHAAIAEAIARADAAAAAKEHRREHC